MQTRNPLLDDIARVLGGALGTAGGVKDELEARVRDRLARILAGMDLPSREEFEAVKAMAAKARAEQEALAKRVAELEEMLRPAAEEPVVEGAQTPQGPDVWDAPG